MSKKQQAELWWKSGEVTHGKAGEKLRCRRAGELVKVQVREERFRSTGIQERGMLVSNSLMDEYELAN